MATLASDLVSDMQRVFPEESQADLLKDLNKVHADLCRRFRLRVGIETVALTAGVQLYAMPANVSAIHQAVYMTASGVFSPLNETTVETMDSRIPGWRVYPSSTPIQYFVDGAATGGTAAQIGLIPTPSMTTSSGYPSLSLDVSYYEGLGLSSPLPPNVPQYDCWYYGTLERVAIRRNDPRYEAFVREYKIGYATLENMVAQAQGARDRGIAVIDTLGASRI